MTPEKLQELRERFPTYSINTLSADEVHELLDHISTLESELQQVKVERDGLREVLQWLDRLGGLGLDKHARIRAALAPAPAARTEGE